MKLSFRRVQVESINEKSGKNIFFYVIYRIALERKSIKHYEALEGSKSRKTMPAWTFLSLLLYLCKITSVFVGMLLMFAEKFFVGKNC
jgi:hypothetical protein